MVAINRFATDTDAELEVVREEAIKAGKWPRKAGEQGWMKPGVALVAGAGCWGCSAGGNTCRRHRKLRVRPRNEMAQPAPTHPRTPPRSRQAPTRRRWRSTTARAARVPWTWPTR